MAVGFEQAFPGASPEQIESVEAELGVELPADYRRFLQQHNGGDLEDNFLPPDADASARYLYSAGPNDDDEIYDLATAAGFYAPDSPSDPEIDPDYLPIGEDDGGNVICLKVRGEDRGAVYFWAHDAFAGTDPFTRLADGFAEFFERLRPIDELELDH
jgi:cell wall assembly regulator SMI1